MKTIALYLLWVVLRSYAAIREAMGAYLFIRPKNADYLMRWYLTPHGEWWFAKWYRKHFNGYFLHRFDASDPSRGWHSHPWKWSKFLVIKGSYLQNSASLSGAKNPDGTIVNYQSIFYPGDVNFISDKDFHNVQLLTKKVWTLGTVGPLHGNEWEFMDEYGNRTPHNTNTPGD